MPEVEVWGFASRSGHQPDLFAPQDKDARAYPGPFPVVAHPPCGPWGKFSWRYKGGEGTKDCAVQAVRQVRLFGGVLEHPAGSRLWSRCGLPRPGEKPDLFNGQTFLVNQVDWGHPAKKPTFLYVVGLKERGPKRPTPKTPSHVIVRRTDNNNELPELPKRLRHLTPLEFARWLVQLARLCKV